MTMDASSGEMLQPQLLQAQQVLAKALDEACASDLDEIDTGELIRIEEALATASKAAKQAVSIRLVRRNQRRGKLGKQGASAEAQGESAAPAPVVATQRVFEDFKGQRWHVFAVYPSEATSERAALPVAYRDGWLAFKSDNEMRRVAPVLANWLEISIDELRELCHKAEVAPKRAHHSLPITDKKLES
jgi:hypothetical protein